MGSGADRLKVHIIECEKDGKNYEHLSMIHRRIQVIPNTLHQSMDTYWSSKHCMLLYLTAMCFILLWKVELVARAKAPKLSTCTLIDFGIEDVFCASC